MKWKGELERTKIERRLKVINLRKERKNRRKYKEWKEIDNGEEIGVTKKGIRG